MVILLIIAGVIILHIAFAVIELSRLKVTEYCISTEKIGKNNKLKIAVLSDIHCISFGKGNSRLFKMLYETKPDVIVISGDLINGMKRKELDFARDFLTELQSSGIPVIYEYGNHESRLKTRDEEAYNEFVRMTDGLVTVLRNNSCKLNTESAENVSFSGLDLPEYMYRQGDFTVNLEKMTEEAIKTPYKVLTDRKGSLQADTGEFENVSCGDDSLYRIVIAHDPSHFELYARAGADLVIAGHYHGGIIRLPFLGGLVSPKLEFFPRYTKGLYFFKESVMCLSAGIGWHNLPIRFMNRPEIVVINLGID